MNVKQIAVRCGVVGMGLVALLLAGAAGPIRFS